MSLPLALFFPSWFVVALVRYHPRYQAVLSSSPCQMRPEFSLQSPSRIPSRGQGPLVCRISISKNVLYEFHRLFKLQSTGSYKAEMMGMKVYLKESGQRGRIKNSNQGWPEERLRRDSSSWRGSTRSRWWTWWGRWWTTWGLNTASPIYWW